MPASHSTAVAAEAPPAPKGSTKRLRPPAADEVPGLADKARRPGKTAAVSATKAPAKPAKAVKAAKTGDAAKPERSPKKPSKPRAKLVRDSFTMPADDFALIADLKARALAGRRETKKSELIRAGLRALVALDDKALLAQLAQLAPVKIGRPKKGH